eukprot:TRINITY_DN32143_c0_g1_i1.p2 TRINITY_DN32143_c0_g1~~TRINITY_DN32143_c0_g1_i1.p2  ORF type:complete len:112 (+),score=3.47 TRINITY_DN32143_c0_g1_i1:163-498(+)
MLYDEVNWTDWVAVVPDQYTACVLKWQTHGRNFATVTSRQLSDHLINKLAGDYDMRKLPVLMIDQKENEWRASFSLPLQPQNIFEWDAISLQQLPASLVITLLTSQQETMI